MSKICPERDKRVRQNQPEARAKKLKATRESLPPHSDQELNLIDKRILLYEEQITSVQVRRSCLNEQRLYFAAKREMYQVRADYMKAKIAAAEKNNANPDPSEIPDDIEIWIPPKSLAKEMFNLLLYSNLHLLLIII